MKRMHTHTHTHAHDKMAYDCCKQTNTHTQLRHTRMQIILLTHAPQHLFNHNTFIIFSRLVAFGRAERSPWKSRQLYPTGRWAPSSLPSQTHSDRITCQSTRCSRSTDTLGREVICQRAQKNHATRANEGWEEASLPFLKQEQPRV